MDWITRDRLANRLHSPLQRLRTPIGCGVCNGDPPPRTLDARSRIPRVCRDGSRVMSIHLLGIDETWWPITLRRIRLRKMVGRPRDGDEPHEQDNEQSDDG
ncbi:MAG: hypothetical protein IIB61_09095 [Planctomycetes bacterium]|nr:hypothetical protein [Planctomycetota bacterium]